MKAGERRWFRIAQKTIIIPLKLVSVGLALRGAGPSQHPQQPIQKGVERVRIEQKVRHAGEWCDDGQHFEAVAGDFARIRH